MTKDTKPNDPDNNRRNDNAKNSLLRRDFIQAAGTATYAGIFGVSATGRAAANEFQAEFARRRVQEARKAWAKGFRGQPHRTLAVLSDGLEARHPDIGPWNGVRAVPDGDKGLELVHENLERLDVPDDIRFFAESRSIPSNAGGRHEYPFTGPPDVHRIEAHLKSSPSGQSNGLRLVLETANGDVIESYAGNEAPHTGIAGQIEPKRDYVLAVENTMRSINGTYFLEAQYFTDNPDGETDPFANVNPNNVTAETPKVLGWYNEDFGISEPHAKPRSGPHQGGHGEFLASIMAGSGRASTPDEPTVKVDSPNEVLVPGDELIYEVEAEPNRGVFAVAFGDNVEVEILGPKGNRLDFHPFDSTINGTHTQAEIPTVHDAGTEIYKVRIRTRSHIGFFGGSPVRPEGVGRVEQVTVGAFKSPENTAGDRTDEEGHSTIHAGIAPNAGLVGLSGWLKARKDLKHLADDFARLFNLRVIDISLGFGNDLGIVGGELSDGSIKAIKALAKTGVLTVSRTPNTQPPALRDRAPGSADEAISVVQAGPWDGIFPAESNEPAAYDEDGEGIYRKPDVTALGCKTDEHIKAAKGADGFRAENEQEPIRDYERWGIVSAQPPFVAGMAGLVAQAMEEDAPPGIALPAPEDAGFAETMRLKQTILATASETPFTAAPWHRREPTYNFGGHDPVEGWGRVNIDAAVEAATRNLTPPSAMTGGRNRSRRDRTSEESRGGQGRPSSATTTVEETAGLKLPRDSRATAGHIAGEAGVYEVTVDFSQYSGDDQVQAGGPPHLDLFVYDGENPAKHGTPNIIAKSQGRTGSASVQFEAGHSSGNNTEGGTYYVVAKLVNVPEAYNSFDIQAQFSLSIEQLVASSDAEKVSDRTGSNGTTSDGPAFLGGKI